MLSPARESALKVLRQVEEKGGYANHLLEEEFIHARLSREDRKLAYLIVYGVLRSRNRLDWVLSRYSDYPLERMTAWIRNDLRMGVYQLLDMPQMRPSVSVDESVRLARKYGHQGTVSLVNAILRKVTAHGQGQLPSLEESPEEHLVIARSHPRWLIKRWLGEYGPELTEKICVSNNLPPPLTVRVNRLKTQGLKDVKQVLSQFLDNPIQTVAIPEGFVIDGPRPLREQRVYKEGWIDIQGLASMLIPHLLDIKPGQRVLDACAGSGGKSCHMADLMGNCGEILAVDQNEKKLKALRNRAKRLGVNILKAVCGDSERMTTWREGIFDRALVDAPCSALGIIKRHPEIRWLKKEEDIGKLSLLQGNILSMAARGVKKGGRLLYCTCSLEPEETGEIRDRFLRENPHFTVIDLKEYVPEPWKGMVKEDGTLCLMPFIHELDGFFAFSVSK